MANVKHEEETKIVRTMDELKEAAHERYGKIIPEGNLKEELEKKVTNNNKGNTASNIALVAGLFAWPVLIAGAVGKVLTTDLKRYSVHNESGKTVFVLKKG